jgi:hypothetical protein
MFFLKYLLHKGKKPHVAMNGTLILQIKQGTVHIRDSYALIKTSLAKLPSMLQFDDDSSKGFFPHKLITSELDLNYRGPVPAEEYFEVNRMNQERQSEFYTWYKKIKCEKRMYLLSSEAVKYCR